MQSTKQKKKPIKKEALTKRDLHELMGTNRPTYSRRHGAIRQK
ncbi:hypothetical protein ACERJO_20830 [Halalkalibacter sp. AB-rgal2]